MLVEIYPFQRSLLLTHASNFWTFLLFTSINPLPPPPPVVSCSRCAAWVLLLALLWCCGLALGRVREAGWIYQWLAGWRPFTWCATGGHAGRCRGWVALAAGCVSGGGCCARMYFVASIAWTAWAAGVVSMQHSSFTMFRNDPVRTCKEVSHPRPCCRTGRAPCQERDLPALSATEPNVSLLARNALMLYPTLPSFRSPTDSRPRHTLHAARPGHAHRPGYARRPYNQQQDPAEVPTPRTHPASVPLPLGRRRGSSHLLTRPPAAAATTPGRSPDPPRPAGAGWGRRGHPPAGLCHTAPLPTVPQRQGRLAGGRPAWQSRWG